MSQLSSTTRRPDRKPGLTKAQAGARKRISYHPKEIQKWPPEKIVRLWDRIQI